MSASGSFTMSFDKSTAMRRQRTSRDGYGRYAKRLMRKTRLIASIGFIVRIHLCPSGCECDSVAQHTHPSPA
jgi:hypothetical protein